MIKKFRKKSVLEQEMSAHTGEAATSKLMQLAAQRPRGATGKRTGPDRIQWISG